MMETAWKMISDQNTVSGLIVAAVVGVITIASRYFNLFRTPKSIAWCQLESYNYDKLIDEKRHIAQIKVYYIKNEGWSIAENIRILLDEKPEKFEFRPGVEFDTKENPDGKFVINIHSLAKDKEIKLYIFDISELYVTSYMLAQISNISFNGGIGRNAVHDIQLSKTPLGYAMIGAYNALALFGILTLIAATVKSILK